MPTKQERNWAMLMHFAQLLNMLFPFLGLIAVIVMWQLKKEESPFIDRHGKIILNWMFSYMLYALAGFLLVYVGVGVLILVILKFAILILAIIWGIRANNGESAPYPLSITFLKPGER
ncbi:MAG TPA: DUF4870 domain-containing protein [Campylobacteraceae bacterium]|jgi:uncharacterized Tic20 family protein|nr:DUF4870 domain-containing protein [Campylobacteraceae bacterium]HHD84140.1 DUF4870 domain-containing protein [Campylobacteraceae bacterium]